MEKNMLRIHLEKWWKRKAMRAGWPYSILEYTVKPLRAKQCGTRMQE